MYTYLSVTRATNVASSDTKDSDVPIMVIISSEATTPEGSLEEFNYIIIYKCTSTHYVNIKDGMELYKMIKLNFKHISITLNFYIHRSQ